MMKIAIVLSFLAATLGACSAPMDAGDAGNSPIGDLASGTSFADGGVEAIGPLPDPPPIDPGQQARVCDRSNNDVIFKALCANPAPQIGSLDALLTAISLGDASERVVAAVGSSNALSSRHVSPLNPAVIVVANDAIRSGPNLIDPSRTRALTYARGAETVEMTAYDPVSMELNFYLLRFQKSCDSDSAGCTTAELFTPSVESGWNSWTLYQDSDLADSVTDCLVCHQPGGPGSPKILRMQEFEATWMHWFPAGDPMIGPTASETLFQGYFGGTHGQEQEYAGVSLSELLEPTSANSGELGAASLNDFILSYWGARGGVPAPLISTTGQDFDFPSIAISQEDAAGTHDIWNAAFAQVVAGERIPIPYYDVDSTDPNSRTAAANSYLAVATNGAAADTLLDPSAILSTDAQQAMSIIPGAGEAPEDLLHHFCGHCHNSRLNQSLSRARFNVDNLANLTAEQKQTAITRLQEPSGSSALMPPARFATLPASALTSLVQYLQQ
jgi:hypothetical protein